MRILQTVNQALPDFDKWVDASLVRRVARGVFLGLFMIYLNGLFIFFIYFTFRHIEMLSGAGSIYFIVWLYGLAFIWAMGSDIDALLWGLITHIRRSSPDKLPVEAPTEPSLTNEP